MEELQLVVAGLVVRAFHIDFRSLQGIGGDFDLRSRSEGTLLICRKTYDYLHPVLALLPSRAPQRRGLVSQLIFVVSFYSVDRLWFFVVVFVVVFFLVFLLFRLFILRRTRGWWYPIVNACTPEHPTSDDHVVAYKGLPVQSFGSRFILPAHREWAGSTVTRSVARMANPDDFDRVVEFVSIAEVIVFLNRSELMHDAVNEVTRLTCHSKKVGTSRVEITPLMRV